LPAYVSASDVHRIFHAIVVTWQASGSGAAFDRFPQIIVNPAAVIERSDGVLLHVTDHQLGHEFVPTESDKLHDHFVAMQDKADRLLRSIGDALGGTPAASDIDLFPGFPQMLFYGRFLTTRRSFFLSREPLPIFCSTNLPLSPVQGTVGRRARRPGMRRGQALSFRQASNRKPTFKQVRNSIARIARCTIGDPTGVM
jgi:hypothetical protein